MDSKARPSCVEEVAAYCKERGNNISAEHFFDYYTANGWRVGRNPMRDWHAAIRLWERNNFGRSQNRAEQRQIENLAVNERVKQRIRERVGVVEQ